MAKLVGTIIHKVRSYRVEMALYLNGIKFGFIFFILLNARTQINTVLF